MTTESKTRRLRTRFYEASFAGTGAFPVGEEDEVWAQVWLPCLSATEVFRAASQGAFHAAILSRSQDVANK